MQPTLSTGTNSGIQTTTQSPQTAGAAGAGGTRASRVQSGTARSVLTEDEGISLNKRQLTTVSLEPTTTQTTGTTNQSNQPVTPAKHDINTTMLIVAIALFALAAWLFWWTGHSVKKTVKSTTNKHK